MPVPRTQCVHARVDFKFSPPRCARHNLCGSLSGLRFIRCVPRSRSAFKRLRDDLEELVGVAAIVQEVADLVYAEQLLT